MNSKEYWEKREAANLVRELKQEKAYEREIERIYKDMLDNAQKEIDAFYSKYADKEGITIADAKKRVSQLDIEAYERKAKRYVKDKDFSAQANEEMRLYNATMKINRLEMLKANIGLELLKGTQELDDFMESILQGRTEDELRRQAGILGKTIKDPKKLAHAIINGSWENASFNGRATFSDLIWGYNAQMKNDLGKMLETGLIQGKNARVLAKEMRKYLIGDPKKGGGAKYNAERLMRTELARVQTEAQKQSFEENGFEMYTFIVNSGCCPICEGISGKHFKVKDMMPGTNAPPMHPHCRCSTAAYEDSDEYEAWLDYLAQGGTTEEWNKPKEKRTNASKTLDDAGNGVKIASESTTQKRKGKEKMDARELLDTVEREFEGKNQHEIADIIKKRAGENGIGVGLAFEEAVARGKLSKRIYYDVDKTILRKLPRYIQEQTTGLSGGGGVYDITVYSPATGEERSIYAESIADLKWLAAEWIKKGNEY